MSTDERRSGGRPGGGDDPETPRGIWVVGVVGLIGAVIGLLGGATTVVAGDLPAVVGVGMIVLAVAQAITMLALVGLTPWAWYATILLYAGSGALNLVQGDAGGVLVSVVVVVYVAAQRDLFVG